MVQLFLHNKYVRKTHNFFFFFFRSLVEVDFYLLNSPKKATVFSRLQNAVSLLPVYILENKQRFDAERKETIKFHSV